MLKKGRVALGRGCYYGPKDKSTLRLNFGCPRKTLDELLRRMKSAI
jgi:bifunctional pyridoxal-dependent enzyme with beta-cystathionase and maltose regulon repressor activities